MKLYETLKKYDSRIACVVMGLTLGFVGYAVALSRGAPDEFAYATGAVITGIGTPIFYLAALDGEKREAQQDLENRVEQ